jgi:hypothetical protein
MKKIRCLSEEALQLGNKAGYNATKLRRKYAFGQLVLQQVRPFRRIVLADFLLPRAFGLNEMAKRLMPTLAGSSRNLSAGSRPLKG